MVRSAVLLFLSSLCCLLVVSKCSSQQVSSSKHATRCGEQELRDHPVLCHMLQKDAQEFSSELHEWAATHGALVDLRRRPQPKKEENSVPREEVVDSAESSGKAIEEKLQISTATTASKQRHLRNTATTRTESFGDNNRTTSTNGFTTDSRSIGNGNQLPVVFAHGMGDSCFNNGVQNIVQHTSKLLNNVYTVCIPTGDSQSDDTRNGYFLNMDASVDVFAAKIKTDPHLQNGFHAIGFSQGNNVIRGYIAKYNTPAVSTFVSVNGVNAGIGAVPYCQPKRLVSSSQTKTTNNSDIQFSMCDLLMEQASKAAYTEYAQEHSFQANYWRDPRPVATERYKLYCQLAKWNNEVLENEAINQTLRENWAKTDQFVWVMATDDKMVWPKEGEHWGAPDPNDPFETILPTNKTEWYQKDLFGLKTAEDANKNVYEQFEGDHLQFTQDDFERWVNMYLRS